MTVQPYEPPDEPTVDELDAAAADAPYDDEKAKERSQKQNPTTTRGLAAAVMLVSGAEPADIAHVLEFDSPEQARRIAEKALSVQFDDIDKSAAKRLLLARYDRLFVSALKRSETARYTGREAAANTALKALAEIARVSGLNAPSEVSVHSPVLRDIERVIAQIAKVQASALPAEADVLDVIEAEVVGDDG